MTYQATFIGRLKGAIGITHRIVTTVEGESEDDAAINLYDRFENISLLVLTPVES